MVLKVIYKFMQNSYKFPENKWQNRRGLIVTAPEKVVQAELSL